MCVVDELNIHLFTMKRNKNHYFFLNLISLDNRLVKLILPSLMNLIFITNSIGEFRCSTTVSYNWKKSDQDKQNKETYEVVFAYGVTEDNAK